MTKRKWKIEVYESPDRRYRWRVRAANGCVVADGSEGYHNRGNAKRAATECKRRMFCAKVVDLLGNKIP